MEINAIVACDEEWGIGKDNSMPWPHNKQDMKWFKENTKNHVVLMGSNTWESLPSKPLPDRINIVCTTKELGEPTVSTWTGDISTGIEYFKSLYKGRKLWIIGGANLYKQAIPLCDHIYLTRIKGVYGCNTFLDKSMLEPFNHKLSSFAIADCEFQVWGKK